MILKLYICIIFKRKNVYIDFFLIILCRIEVVYFEYGCDCSKCGFVLRVIYFGIIDFFCK